MGCAPSADTHVALQALASLSTEELALRLEEAGIDPGESTARTALVDKLIRSAQRGHCYQLNMFSTASDGVPGWVRRMRDASGELDLPEMRAHVSVADSTVWFLSLNTLARGTRLHADYGTAR